MGFYSAKLDDFIIKAEDPIGNGCQANYYRALHACEDKITLRHSPLFRACLGEFMGTAIMVIFGLSVLAQVFLGDEGEKKHGDFICISIGWGMAVMMGVFFSGRNGHGHINPAITLAFTLIGKCSFVRVVPYTLSQFLGAFMGALVVYIFYHEKILDHVRGPDNGLYLLNTTGNIFFTNPWASHMTCFVDQLVGTAILSGGALAIIDRNGWNLPDNLHPVFLGLLVFTIVGCFAANAGAALNPARDLGPRIFLACVGWGSNVFTGKHYYFWIPIVAPYLGAILGAVIYKLTVGLHLDRVQEEPIKDQAIAEFM